MYYLFIIEQWGCKAIKGLDYIRNLPVDKLAKVLIRSCPSDIGLKDYEECPKINCVICWIHALESDIDENAAAILMQTY